MGRADHRLTRYPVKSLAGEQLTQAVFEQRGVVGDRRWAVQTADGGLGSSKTTRRFRRVDGLLDLQAVLTGEVPELVGGPRVDDPRAGELLSELLGQPLVLRQERDVPHHDDSPVHVITTGALQRLGDVDPRRFRANVLIEGDEADWQGGELALGDEVVLRLGPPMPRCRMVDLPQAGIAAHRGLLRRAPAFGLQAEVVRTGTARVGDVARLC